MSDKYSERHSRMVTGPPFHDGESRSDVGGTFVTPEYGLDVSGTVGFTVGPNDTIYRIALEPRRTYFATSAPLWRRLWFVVSCVPRYLISGSVEVP